MRKLILWDMLTLDGRFVDPGRTLDWFHFDDELERYIVETQTSAGALFFGRVTYEMMVDYWPTEQGAIADFMNAVPRVVFSRTLETVDWDNTRLVAGNVPEEVGKLKEEPGGDIFTYGSADLSATLIEHGLVDEYRIGLNPILLGEGEPFLQGRPRPDPPGARRGDAAGLGARRPALRSPRRMTRHPPIAAVPYRLAGGRWEIAPGFDDEVAADTLLTAINLAKHKLTRCLRRGSGCRDNTAREGKKAKEPRAARIALNASTR